MGGPVTRAVRGTRGEHLARERTGPAADARPRGEVALRVAAEEAEGEVRGARGVGGRHPGVRVLLELERPRPALLDRVAQPVERAHAGIPAPGEGQLPSTVRADQLVVDDVRG